MGGGRGPAFGRPRPAIPGAKLALPPEWQDAAGRRPARARPPFNPAAYPCCGVCGPAGRGAEPKLGPGRLMPAKRRSIKPII